MTTERPDDSPFDTIPDAIAAVQAGDLVIVVDDEDRENEGDFIGAAAAMTPELVNFMTKEGRGLLCTAITPERAEALDLDLMVESNSSLYSTPFTVSVDYRQGTSTGISADDRATTIRALADPDASAYDFARPGHVFHSAPAAAACCAAPATPRRPSTSHGSRASSPPAPSSKS